jgi:hypothetical protein
MSKSSTTEDTKEHGGQHQREMIEFLLHVFPPCPSVSCGGEYFFSQVALFSRLRCTFLRGDGTRNVAVVNQ